MFSYDILAHSSDGDNHASLVNKSFGDHVSIAGSPVKVISENIDWQR